MKTSPMPKNPRHAWKFRRYGGVDQVILRDAADLQHLEELDLKLWMALSVPTQGVLFDPATAALVDTNGDGRIHPGEVLDALRWAREMLNDPAILLQPMDALPLAAIRDPAVAASARHVLANLGKGDASQVSLGDVMDRGRIFAQTLFNGDGIVPPEAAGDDPAAEALVRAVVAALGGVTDRCGRPGVDAAMLARFFAEGRLFLDWHDRAEACALPPLGPEGTAKAAEAVQAIRGKLDDYFARCRLAAYDERAAGILNRDAADYRALAASPMTATASELADFPLATIAANRPLPLAHGINPAWRDAVAHLDACVVRPLFGAGRDTLGEADWAQVQRLLAPYAQHQTERPDTAVAALGADRLRACLADDVRKRVEALIERDLALAPESERIATVEKLLRFCLHLPELLANTVNFADFYGRTDAIFQVGTLFLDGRACALCIEVADEAKHTALAGLSGFFLAYCELSRPALPKRKIVAAITDGDCDNVMVGRNGIFQDRQGLVWDATVTRIVSAPISVRQAFWLPYKRFVRLVEEQIAKRAQAADDTATTRWASSVETALAANPAKPSAPAPTAPGKKIELGTIALIGTAIGGISALVGGFLKALFGLGYWLPAGVVGILLLVSGPSMLLASLKLRRRNLAPLLDANGWAINTHARVNLPFGASLTQLAAPPLMPTHAFQDPFADRRVPWKRWLAIALVALATALWYFGQLDRYLPACCRRAPVETGSTQPADPLPTP